MLLASWRLRQCSAIGTVHVPNMLYRDAVIDCVMTAGLKLAHQVMSHEVVAPYSACCLGSCVLAQSKAADVGPHPGLVTVSMPLPCLEPATLLLMS